MKSCAFLLYPLLSKPHNYSEENLRLCSLIIMINFYFIDLDHQFVLRYMVITRCIGTCPFVIIGFFKLSDTSIRASRLIMFQQCLKADLLIYQELPRTSTQLHLQCEVKKKKKKKVPSSHSYVDNIW